ncbi:ABC transporter ATP-binding protein [Streptomyces sp. UNOC14_S4]|uniref:ATP-binding cassette domain-containing protein n=1 Tax=Streptomyces sp. UNOC14_S4 TaxID=2872340 RepID=UPI001E56B8DE|nr:ABC transporter ATP-binding protein [Streptomyces sp. UNOC14_S4]MCC3770099.1 ABC transporter ATP-binding protein/permease [Streptomyces sp. UNOC14_S4]
MRTRTAGLPVKPRTAGLPVTSLMADLLRHRRAAVLLLLWSAVDSLPALAGGWCVAATLDDGVLAHRPGVAAAWLLALGGAYVLRAVASRVTTRHLADVVEPLRDAWVTRIVRATLDRGGSDAAVARVTGQTESVRRLTGTLLLNVRDVALSLLAAAVGLAALSPRVALLALPCVALALALLAWQLRPLAAIHRDAVRAGETLAAETGTTVRALRDLAACGAQDQALARLSATADRQAALTRALARAGVGRGLAVAVGGHLPVVAMLAAAPWLTSDGTMATGTLAGATTYLYAQVAPLLRTLAQSAASVVLPLLVTVRRLTEATAATETTRATAAGAAPRPASGSPVPCPDLEFQDVTFAYGPASEPVLRELSLTVPYGQHLAVVGPSGIGKSTLADLAAGLARPGSGRVLLGGRPLDTIAPEAVRRTVGLVPQESYVFDGTLRENLTWLRPDRVGDDELRRAAEALGAQALVRRLGGFDARTAGDDPGLGAGDRQLLTLLRLYLSPAPLIILDEATSALGPRAEERVEHAFARRPGSLLVIAHRMTSALRADRVLVLDGARATAGTHDDLVRSVPAYASLAGHWHEPTTSGEPARR